MTALATNLADTFNQWRLNTNAILTDLGDLTALTTTAQGSAVLAINEVDGDIGVLTSLTTTATGTIVGSINELDGEIGVLTALTTTAKGTIVAAVNELDSDIGVLTSLTTTAQGSAVLAINELVTNQGDISTLTTAAGDLVGAINEVSAASGLTTGNLSSASSAIVVTGGTGAALSNVSLALNTASINLSGLTGTLPVASGGTGTTSLSNIVSANTILAVANGSATVVGGDVTLTLNSSLITTLGNLTALTVAGPASITSLTVTGTSTLGIITASGAMTYNSATPINQAGVGVAAITSDTHCTTKAYVDNKLGVASSEVVYDTDFVPLMAVPSGENHRYTLAHSQSAEPDFIMVFSQGFEDGDGVGHQRGSQTYSPMMSADEKTVAPGYHEYDATNIYVRHGGTSEVSAFRGLTPGERVHRVYGGNVRIISVSKTADYDTRIQATFPGGAANPGSAEWFPVALSTNYTIAHGLGKVPEIVIVELSNATDGSGWRIPSMGSVQIEAGGNQRQFQLVSMDNTNVTVRSGTTGSGNALSEFYNTDGTLTTPTTAFGRIKCYDWEADYDSGWTTISTAIATRNHFLLHDLNIIPSLAMLYLAEDIASDGDTTLSGTGTNPTGWVTTAMSGWMGTNQNRGTALYHIGKKVATIKGGSVSIARFTDKLAAVKTPTTGVFRLLLWK